MFKIFDIGVKLEQIPNWVWVFVVIALFFFGILYTVPEARQAAGCLISEASLRSGLSQPSNDEGRKACGAHFRGWQSAGCGKPAPVCFYEFDTEAEAATVCGRSNITKKLRSDRIFVFYTCSRPPQISN